MSFQCKRTRTSAILNQTTEGENPGANHGHRQNVEDVVGQGNTHGTTECQRLSRDAENVISSSHEQGLQRRRISSSNEHSNAVQSANDEDIDNLNSNNSQIPEWPDHVSFDEWEKVEMRDKDGNKKVRGGTIRPNHVWTLPPGDRFVVPFNSLNQPIRKGGHVLVWFLGDIAKNGDLCPIGEVN